MEKACETLRLEIRQLQEEQARLENIYIINSLSKLADNDEEDKLNKWYEFFDI